MKNIENETSSDTEILAKPSPVGVVGMGSLGCKLAAQISHKGLNVISFDPDPSKNKLPDVCHGIDARLGANPTAERRIKAATDISELMARCAIVHWAVPSELLKDLPDVKKDGCIILHDSVMDNSRTAIKERLALPGIFVPAHCLMNEDLRVFVSDEFENSGRVSEHFQRIGLNPKFTTVVEHDRLMARTQGIFALLIDSGLPNELRFASDEGDLTLSATELLRALEHRESKWTDSTLKSILTNPQIMTFVSEMAESCHET